MFRISEAASLLGISDDTVRRLVETGKLACSRDKSGRKVIAGKDLAHYAQHLAEAPTDPTGTASSARNRFTGLVTKITKDKVMAEVQLLCGPFTIVSLMTAESVDRLGLEPGKLAVASIKSTMVVVDSANKMEATR